MKPDLIQLAEYVKDTCLLFGASPYTTYTVAGLFVQGLEREWTKSPSAPMPAAKRTPAASAPVQDRPV